LVARWDTSGFAGKAFAFLVEQSEFEDALSELLGEQNEYEKIGWDYYDSSLEIYGLTDACRLSDEAQRFISGQGFVKVYLNHLNGWETHYTWNLPFEAVSGWRRKRTQDGFEINYWPKAWNTPVALEWLKTGYMKIVGDSNG
jgi:hypothetical protein